MDFLSATRKKIVRSVLYKDQEFSHFELEILHTPIYQRLYDLKQLGYSDRVFPDAVHSRFNHLLGVTEVAGQMVDRVADWLGAPSQATLTFAYGVRGADNVWSTENIDVQRLSEHVKQHRPVVRLMALLHDLTHAAYGHTLEDEVSVFREKHDAPERQARFFDALIAQLVIAWAVESGIPGVDYGDLAPLNAFKIDEAHVLRLAAAIVSTGAGKAQAQKLADHLEQLELAFRLLMCLEGAHLVEDPAKLKPPETQLSELTRGLDSKLLVTKVLGKVRGSATAIDLVIHRDLFMVDIVGNTICADLIDYARRDPDNAGLKATFDDRLLRYLCVVSVDRRMVPGPHPAIRTGIQIFTDKLRTDVLSEMSALLKVRYLVSERILFHPTKCAAGACLGTAVQLMGLSDIPPWVQALGDQAFIGLLQRLSDGLAAYASAVTQRSGKGEFDLFGESPGEAKDIATGLWPTEPDMGELVLSCIEHLRAEPRQDGSPASLISDRARASRRILWKLASRRYPKLAYRLDGNHSSGTADTDIVGDEYNRPAKRFQLERTIEELCSLPMGTVHIHCPRRQTSMKVAHALVVGNDPGKVAHLRNVTEIYRDVAQLKPYEQEIEAIEQMYKSIWRMNIYLDSAHRRKSNVVALCAEDILGLNNDPLLAYSDDARADGENVYAILAGRKREFAIVDLPGITKYLDGELVSVRQREGSFSAQDLVSEAIQKVRVTADGGKV